MQRPVVPIMSGNTRYLGLAVPEWCVVGLVTCFFLVFVRVPFLMLLIIEVPVLVFYVSVFAKMEENIFFVLKASRAIPNIIYGTARKPLPLERMRVENDLGKTAHN
jgi:hypothetical protein